VTGVQHLIGTTAVVESNYNDQPLIRLQGELWTVQSDQPLQPNDRVTVTAANGVVLKVKKDKGEH
jgi:membrane-bound serine protease (ClpP class)